MVGRCGVRRSGASSSLSSSLSSTNPPRGAIDGVAAIARTLAGSMHGAHWFAITAIRASLLTQGGGAWPVSSAHIASTKTLQFRSSRWYVFPWNLWSSSATTSATSAGVMSVYPTISVLRKRAGGGASRGAVSKIPDEA